MAPAAGAAGQLDRRINVKMKEIGPASVERKNEEKDTRAACCCRESVLSGRRRSG